MTDKASAPLGRVPGFFYELRLDRFRLGEKDRHVLTVDSHWLAAKHPGPQRQVTITCTRPELVELRNQIDYHLAKRGS